MNNYQAIITNIINTIKEDVKARTELHTATHLMSYREDIAHDCTSESTLDLPYDVLFEAYLKEIDAVVIAKVHTSVAANPETTQQAFKSNLMNHIKATWEAFNKGLISFYQAQLIIHPTNNQLKGL